jgi:hypothetical protein
MAARARKSGRADRPVELAELNHIRLSRNWSYQQLSDDMATAGFPIAPKTIHALILNEDKRPYDRTLYQIRQYLAVANPPQPEAAAS